MKKALFAMALVIVIALNAFVGYAVEYKDRDTVKQVQQALNDAGFDCGKPDGSSGKKTKAAIKSYQEDRGLPATGVIDDALLIALGLMEEPEPIHLQLTEADINTKITFGSYPQTSKGKDRTPIEWIVLDVQDGKALLLSDKVLDCKPYHTKKVDVTWEDCSLREWLNTDFLATAFTAEERAVILLSTVKNPGNWRGLYGCSDTEDYVFLLSNEELEQYAPFGEVTDSLNGVEALLTDYAIKRGAGRGDTNKKRVYYVFSDFYWLRSAGVRPNTASNVYTYLFPGVLYDLGFYVNEKGGGVRPAIWVALTEPEEAEAPEATEAQTEEPGEAETSEALAEESDEAQAE